MKYKQFCNPDSRQIGLPYSISILLLSSLSSGIFSILFICRKLLVSKDLRSAGQPRPT